MSKKRSVQVGRDDKIVNGFFANLGAIVSKLHDQGALLLIGLYLIAGGLSAFRPDIDPVIPFGSATALGIAFMIYRAIEKVVDGSNVARQIDRDRDLELAKLRDKADRRRIGSRASEPNVPR